MLGSGHIPSFVCSAFSHEISVPPKPLRPNSCYDWILIGRISTEFTKMGVSPLLVHFGVLYGPFLLEILR
jgi:hypothetical protein